MFAYPHNGNLDVYISNIVDHSTTIVIILIYDFNL